MRRRDLLVAGALAGLLPRAACAQSRREFIDAAKRRVALPAKVERIYAAGPPASILVFAIAPDKLIGWTSAFREAERPFVAARYADLPTLGRLTGRGNTANVESIERLGAFNVAAELGRGGLVEVSIEQVLRWNPDVIWIDFPPSINRLIGLRWLVRILYPRAFPEHLRPIVRDFYTRCYHQTPTAAQLDQLLRTALPA